SRGWRSQASALESLHRCDRKCFPGRFMQPSDPQRKVFTEPIEALAYIRQLYEESVAGLRNELAAFARGSMAKHRTRAFYPYLRVRTETMSRPDSRRSFGFVAGPGVYETTLTRPDLF